MAKFHFAIYEPPTKGLPFLVAFVAGNTVEVLPAKTRAVAEQVLEDQMATWEAKQRLAARYLSPRKDKQNAPRP